MNSAGGVLMGSVPAVPEAHWIASLRIASGAADPPVAWVPVAWLIERLAAFEYLPLYLGLALLAAWSLKGRDPERARECRVFAVQLAAAGIVCLTLVATAQAALALPRPPSATAAHDLTNLHAFPSAHAAFAAVLAWSAGRLLAWSGRIALLALVLGAGLAGVALGKHYWLDIYAGWLLGAACAWLAATVLRTAERDRWAAASFALAAFVLMADLLTKLAASGAIAYATAVPITSFFNLVHWRNPGAAFSFLSDATGWQRPFLISVATLASVWLARAIRAPTASPLERLAFGAILGGAAANGVDRALRGAVVDWLDFHVAGFHWPAFNLADVGITLGAAGLLVAALRPTGRLPMQERA